MMDDHLDLPPELRHLMEKRSGEDRRKKDRRRSARRHVDLGPLGSMETSGGLDQAALEERRGTRRDRRKKGRRVAARRKADG